MFKMKFTKALSLALFISLFLFPVLALAQEPTDRPFPAVQATATDRPFPAAQATATDRPFPAAATSAVEATEEATAVLVEAETTPELLLADIQATASAAQAQIVQLESERDGLKTELEASQADNGATTFALVIIVVGVLLAFAVFFGLRRSGE